MVSRRNVLLAPLGLALAPAVADAGPDQEPWRPHYIDHDSAPTYVDPIVAALFLRFPRLQERIGLYTKRYADARIGSIATVSIDGEPMVRPLNPSLDYRPRSGVLVLAMDGNGGHVRVLADYRRGVVTDTTTRPGVAVISRWPKFGGQSSHTIHNHVLNPDGRFTLGSWWTFYGEGPRLDGCDLVRIASVDHYARSALRLKGA